jgi:hypothetical protein
MTSIGTHGYRPFRTSASLAPVPCAPAPQLSGQVLSPSVEYTLPLPGRLSGSLYTAITVAFIPVNSSPLPTIMKECRNENGLCRASGFLPQGPTRHQGYHRLAHAPDQRDHPPGTDATDPSTTRNAS